MGIHHPILPNFVYFEFPTIKGFLKIIWKAITDKSEDTELVFCKSFQELHSELSVVSEQICNGNSSDDILQVLEIPFQALEISWNHTINEFPFNKSITWLKGKVEKNQRFRLRHHCSQLWVTPNKKEKGNSRWSHISLRHLKPPMQISLHVDGFCQEGQECLSWGAPMSLGAPWGTRQGQVWITTALYRFSSELQTHGSTCLKD